MSALRKITTAHAPAPAGAYSQGIVAGDYLYTAGLGPHDPTTGAIVGSDVATQTQQVMRNLGSILEREHLTFAHVVKTTVHLADLHADFEAFNREYEASLELPYPVRTTVGSVLAPGVLVEIDAVALLVRDEATPTP